MENVTCAWKTTRPHLSFSQVPKRLLVKSLVLRPTPLPLYPTPQAPSNTGGGDGLSISPPSTDPSLYSSCSCLPTSEMAMILTSVKAPLVSNLITPDGMNEWMDGCKRR